MYMYLFLPKDGCGAGTPVAPEEKNIVDMPAMDFCCSTPLPSLSSLFMLGPMYFRILQKQLLKRNANSNHQVCYNLKKRRDNKSERYIQEDLMQN